MNRKPKLPKPRKKRELSEVERLAEIASIIERVDDRCALHCTVTPTHQEITLKEIQRIYKLAKG